MIILTKQMKKDITKLKGNKMHKMSKESASTLVSLQKRLDKAEKINKIYEKFLDKLLLNCEKLCEQLDKEEDK
tara:strand:+ start:894 stop:1112 length:219 start_codon:yes stop_codon:yes gene_type:complete